MASGDGLILITPSSVVVTGSGSETATTTSSGKVEYANAATVSLNGVFSSSYTNYMLVSISEHDSTEQGLSMRMRVSGTDQTVAYYQTQRMLYDGSAFTATSFLSQTSMFLSQTVNTSAGAATTAYLNNPFLAQATILMTVDVYESGDVAIADYAARHDVNTSCDGFTIFPSSGAITGSIMVMGFEE